MSEETRNSFVTTRWTRVLAARGDSDSARLALSELCSAYYSPVVAFLTVTGCGAEEPRDVAHDFFASLIEGKGLLGAEPSRGRFRSYLIGALKHYLSNRRLLASRLKRGGTAEHVPLITGTDTGTGHEIAVQEGQHDLDALFDREWALAVVERSLALLERESTESGNGPQYSLLKSWLSIDEAAMSQATAASTLNMSEGAIKVAVHRLRKRYREIVRMEIAQTLPDGEDVQTELNHLVKALSR